MHDFRVHYEGREYNRKNIDPCKFGFIDLVREIICVIPGLMDNCVSAKFSFGIPGKEERWNVFDEGSLIDMFDMFKDVKEINVYLTHVQRLSQDLRSDEQTQNLRENERIGQNEGDESGFHSDKGFSGDYNLGVDDENIALSDDGDDDFVVSENQVAETDEDSLSSLSESSEEFVSSDDCILFMDDIGGVKRWVCDNGEKITLEKGNVFLDVREYRDVLKRYAIQEGFELLRQKNERARVTALCSAKGCPWRIHASLGKDKCSFVVKSLNPEHTCLRTGNKSDATSTWIAGQLIDELSADFGMGYDLMYQSMNSKCGVDPSRSRLYKAKRKAKDIIEGKNEHAYSLLPAYAELVKKYNPGSIFKIEYYEMSERVPHRFKRAFLCLEACKSGFIKGCRPFIGLDGCHLKGQFRGVLLSATGIDGNGEQFPLACGVVEKENNSSWHWFLERLEEVIGLNYEGIALTFMTDRQKGLSEMVNEVFPMAQHRNCCVHLCKNFRGKFSQMILSVDLWNAARAFTKQEFAIHMKRLETHNKDAYSWLSKIPLRQWARHTFSTMCKVDHVTNNNAESFNNWIDRLRSKSIIQIFEHLRMKLMGRFHRRYQQGCGWLTRLCENVKKELDMIVFEARHCTATPAGRGEFQVKDGTKSFMVNQEIRRCNCLVWEYSGIPCKHAVVCIVYLRAKIEDFVNEYFLKDKYLAAYEQIIHPQPDIGTIEALDKVYPPFLTRLPGRPRLNRRLEANETTAMSSSRKRRTLRCTNCQQLGHNSRTCQRAPIRDKRTNKRQRIDNGSQASNTHISAQEKVLQRRFRRNEKKRKTCQNQESHGDDMQVSQGNQTGPYFEGAKIMATTSASQGSILSRGRTRFVVGGTFERRRLDCRSYRGCHDKRDGHTPYKMSRFAGRSAQ